MSVLDRLGKRAMEVLEKGVDRATEVRDRVQPIAERLPLPDAVKDKFRAEEVTDEAPVRAPEQNRSPFAKTDQDAAPEGPVADPDRPAQMYGRSTCPWTGRAKQLLVDHGVDFDYVDLMTSDGGRFEPRLIRETKQAEGPYVFLRGEFVGGYHALNEIVRLGQLDVMTSEQRDDAPSDGRVRIVIPKRNEHGAAPGEHGNPNDRK